MKKKRSTYPGYDLYVDMPSSGGHVKRVQRELNADRLKNPKDNRRQPLLKVDGEYGAKTEKRIEQFQRHHDLSVNGIVGPGTWAKLFGEKRGHAPLRVHAHRVALTMLGVMEVGGNNVGPKVSALIRENGGTPGEPWCGDGMAYCYRHAGSKRVSRSWAAVRLIRGLLGIFATSNPKTGDLVRFDFSSAGLDHVGMFECWCDSAGRAVRRARATHIRTIEFNTGPVGAVSDSATGGDGVYRKVRARSLVHDYLHVAG